MNDAIGMSELIQPSEGSSSSDAPKLKKGEVSKPVRLAFVHREAVKDRKIGPTTIMKRMAKKYGLGMDYYEIRTAMEVARAGKPRKEASKMDEKKRDPVVEKESKLAYLKRERFAKKMLHKMPNLSHVNLNKMAVRKFGREITDTVYAKYSTAAKPQKSFKAKTIEGVKASLRTGTTPLKTEAKKMGQFFVACGVKQATFTVVDGIPKWHITEEVITEV